MRKKYAIHTFKALYHDLLSQGSIDQINIAWVEYVEFLYQGHELTESQYTQWQQGPFNPIRKRQSNG